MLFRHKKVNLLILIGIDNKLNCVRSLAATSNMTILSFNNTNLADYFVLNMLHIVLIHRFFNHCSLFTLMMLKLVNIFMDIFIDNIIIYVLCCSRKNAQNIFGTTYTVLFSIIYHSITQQCRSLSIIHRPRNITI